MLERASTSRRADATLAGQARALHGYAYGGGVRRRGGSPSTGGARVSVSDKEPVNGRVHLGGAVLAAVGLFVLVGVAAAGASWRHVVGLCVFGVTSVLMFAASALYHLSPCSARNG